MQLICACQEIDQQELQTQLLAHSRALQSRINDRLNSAQAQYKRDYGTRVHDAPTFLLSTIVYSNEPLLAASCVGDTKAGHNQL